MFSVYHCINGTLETLALSLFHRDAKDAPFMVMTAYLDESGTHGKHSPAVVVAGFIANAAGWSAFETDFRQLLNEYEVTRFHAKKFRARQGQFVGWPAEKRKTFMGRFIKLFENHLADGFAASLLPKDYDGVYRASALPKRIRKDSKYGICFRVCLWMAVHFMLSRKVDWPLSIVLEDGDPNAGDALRIFKEVKDHVNGRYGEVLDAIAFQTKDRLPLAAADMFAYGSFRSSSTGIRFPAVARPPDSAGLRMRKWTLTTDTLLDLQDMLLEGRVIPERVEWTSSQRDTTTGR